MTREKTITKKPKMGKRQRKEEIAAYLFIAPVVIGLSIFYIFPFLQYFPVSAEPVVWI